MGQVYDYLQAHGKVRLSPGQTEKTIASGAISIDRAAHVVDTEADAATDDLDTIAGGLHGDLLILSPANAARTVVIKHATGNIYNPGSEDVSLAEATDAIFLYRGVTNWTVVGVSTLVPKAPQLRRTTGTIISARVLTLNATPLPLIPAPGAGLATIVESVRWFLKHNGTDYVADAGEDLTLKYTNAAGDQVVDFVDGDGLPEASADDSEIANGATNLVVVANAAIVAHVLVGEWATGDGDLHYEILYRVVDYDLSD